MLGGLAAVVGGAAAVGGAPGRPLGAAVAAAGRRRVALVGAGLAAASGPGSCGCAPPAGSGLWLRVESFRRFLAESEAYHAEEAAKRGVLREYTAWAVAVGEIDRWSRAVPSSSIIPQDAGLHYVYMAPLLLTSTITTATAPVVERRRAAGSAAARHRRRRRRRGRRELVATRRCPPGGWGDRPGARPGAGAGGIREWSVSRWRSPPARRAGRPGGRADGGDHAHQGAERPGRRPAPAGTAKDGEALAGQRVDHRPAEEHAEADAAGVPNSATVTASPRTIDRSWRRVWPTARSSPSSRVRSWIDSDSVLAMPMRAMTMASASSP